MKQLFGFAAALCLVACSGRQSKAEDQPAASSFADTVDVTSVPKDTVKGCRPTETFIALVKYMDSSAYHIDSSTISETTMLFAGMPLSPEDYNSSFMHSQLKDSTVFVKGSKSFSSASYDPDYDLKFGRVQCIFTFSWRIPDLDGLKRRGTVEEWQFDADSTARFAYAFLVNEYQKMGFPFLKTGPYYLQHGNCLYLFHSNHTGVSYRHKPFHAWLKNRCARS